MGGEERCSDESSGTNDGSRDRSLQALQTRDPSTRTRKTKDQDQDTQGHKTGLRKHFNKIRILLIEKKMGGSHPPLDRRSRDMRSVGFFFSHVMFCLETGLCDC